jgi:hypothetical protein
MANAALVQCTFYGNAAPNGGNASVDCGSDVSIANCIFAASSEGVGLYADPFSTTDISCTDIFGNIGGDWVGEIADHLGLDGNISLDPMFCGADTGDLTLREGSPCLPDYNPDCGQIGAHPKGCNQPLGLSDGTDDPERSSGPVIQLTNFPNPFNPVTVIRYDLPYSGQVQLKIYDVTGALIKTLTAGRRQAGRHEIVWRGDDSRGMEMAAGVYFCLLETGGGERISQRMVLLK